MSETHADTIAKPRLHWRIIDRILTLPRITRIILIIVFSLSVALVVTPLVDYIYLTTMFTFETRILPSLFTAAAGVIMYVAGWYLIVGFAGEKSRSRTAVLVYCLLGCAAFIGMTVLIISGLANLGLG